MRKNWSNQCLTSGDTDGKDDDSGVLKGTQLEWNKLGRKMELKGFKNIRYEGFEKTLRGAAISMDVFLSDAVWALYIKSPKKSIMDARIYDVLFMSRVAVLGAVDPQPGQKQVNLPSEFRVITNRGEVTLVAHSHPKVMALCISTPEELRQ